MGWAAHHIEKLERGETVEFRPRGGSMEPLIKSGQLVTVEPTPHDELKVGDIVLCKVGRAEYLHLVKGIETIRSASEVFTSVLRFTIGNNKGHINGKTIHVYGKVIKIA